jgi:hypothetical protein
MNWKIAIFGGVGGIAVPLMNEALKLMNYQRDIPSIGFALGAVALFAIGYFVVAALQETIPLKALVLGLSLPATITSLIQSSPIGQAAATPPSAFDLDLVPAAYAQEVSVKAPAGEFQMILKDADLNVIEQRTISSTDGTMPIPPETRKIEIEAADLSFEKELDELKENATVEVEIEERSEFWRGFLQALGGSGAKYDVDVKVAQ